MENETCREKFVFLIAVLAEICLVFSAVHKMLVWDWLRTLTFQNLQALPSFLD